MKIIQAVDYGTAQNNIEISNNKFKKRKILKLKNCTNVISECG